MKTLGLSGGVAYIYIYILWGFPALVLRWFEAWTLWVCLSRSLHGRLPSQSPRNRGPGAICREEAVGFQNLLRLGGDLMALREGA